MSKNAEIQMTGKALAYFEASGTRLVKLRQKLAARAGVPGYEKNCEAIKAEIARLEGSTVHPASTERVKSETTSTEAPVSDDA